MQLFGPWTATEGLWKAMQIKNPNPLRANAWPTSGGCSERIEITVRLFVRIACPLHFTWGATARPIPKWVADNCDSVAFGGPSIVQVGSGTHTISGSALVFNAVYGGAPTRL